MDLPKSIEAYVHHCSDGDTCRVEIGDALWLNVRLAGIDAPEVRHGKSKPGQPLGEEAKAFLNDQIRGKMVMVRQMDVDGYNRPVVELQLGGQLINLRLVSYGYAEAYRGPAKRLNRTPYFAAEDAAKKAKKGIWALPGYVPPPTYRSRLKLR